MRKIILIAVINSVNFAADVSISISPDSIYVGSLLTIHLSVNNLQKDEQKQILDYELFVLIERNLQSKMDKTILECLFVGIYSYTLNIMFYVYLIGLYAFPG